MLFYHLYLIHDYSTCRRQSQRPATLPSFTDINYWNTQTSKCRILQIWTTWTLLLKCYYNCKNCTFTNNNTLHNTLHTSFHQKESLGSLNYVPSEYALFSASPDSVARVYSLLLEPLSYSPAVSLDWLFYPVSFGLCSLVVHAVMFYSPH